MLSAVSLLRKRTIESRRQNRTSAVLHLPGIRLFPLEMPKLRLHIDIEEAHPAPQASQAFPQHGKAGLDRLEAAKPDSAMHALRSSRRTFIIYGRSSWP